MSVGATMLDKIWDEHVVARIEDDAYLIHIDRHITQETTCPAAFDGLWRRGMTVHDPELTFGTIDHIISTAPGRTGETYKEGSELVELMRRDASRAGVQLFDVDDRRQGIVHVISPELGLALPGTTLVCADSHTATSGGLGALAWGIGTSETEHVLATQMLIQRKPKRMRVTFEGAVRPGVYAKDIILHLIGEIGIGAGRGYAVEYAGPAIRAMPIEGRLTICNMSIELGARYGFIAPDEITFAYLKGRPFAPTGANWELAVAHWRTLASDEDAVFDREVTIDCERIAPQISWGTTPEEVIAIDQRIPDPAAIADTDRRGGVERSLRYQGLEPGQTMEGLPIDVAFIGSCTNSRLSDLEAAAAVAKGRHVAPGVRALVVPGSSQVRRAAEAAGLDKIFTAAGFEWREAGCSMCLAINDDVVPPGQRCVATSNRNFENRQGPRSRTHLASPAVVAAAAVNGSIIDPRKLVD